MEFAIMVINVCFNWALNQL